MKNVAFGFFQYFNGLKFSLVQKKLRGHLLLLSAINVVLFFLIITGLISHLDVFLQSHIQLTGAFLQKIYYYLVYVLALVATFIISGLLVYFFCNIFLGVFYGDILSKKYFELQNYKYDFNQKTFSQKLKYETAKFLKILVILSLTVFSFFLTLLPGLGLVGVFFSSLVLAFDMMDYGFEVMGLTIKQRFTFFKQNLSIFIGFSLGLMVVMAIPLINVLFIPSSIIAASHLLVGIKKGRA